MAELWLDYEFWRGAHFDWPSLAAFLGAGKIQDGVHTIQAGGLPIDLLMVDGKRAHKGSQRVLPVFFSGAVTARQGKPGPFFSGANIARAKGIAALCISDPTLALDPGLELAWYAGNQRQRTQDDITWLLAGIARSLDVELLLVGGSGGGFATLVCSARLGNTASALVWNPQTDLLRYYRPAVRAYLESCLPEVSWQTDDSFTKAPERLASLGIEHSVIDHYAMGDRPRRLLYLQNADDVFHVRQHAGALLSRLEVRDQGHGCYVDHDDRMLFWFGSWGTGHDPLPKPMLSDLLDVMLDPAAVPAVPNAWLRDPESAAPLRAGRYPLSFRHAANDVRIAIETRHGAGKLYVKASLRGNAENALAPQYAFYVYAGTERIYVRWYKDSAEEEFALSPGQVPTRVTVFVLDSFGEKKQASAPVGPVQFDTGSSEAPLPPSVPDIFILGSCVSRDAFATIQTGMTLVRYVARTSLASGFHPVPAPERTLPGLDVLESKWQRTMVETDLTRRLPRLLAASSHAVVVLDLIDERFPLLMLDGVPITVSTEFLKTGFRIDEGRVLGYASRERMQLWKRGADRFLATVDPNRIIINKVFWASHSEDGVALDNQQTISAHNTVLKEMYEYLAERHAFAEIDYPPELLVADSKHRWGLSPFHYVPELYAHTISSLDNFVATRRRASE